MSMAVFAKSVRGLRALIACCSKICKTHDLRACEEKMHQVRIIVTAESRFQPWDRDGLEVVAQIPLQYVAKIKLP